MKKGFIFLLLALALIVLVSPGLIGRLAERSLDESLRTGTVETDSGVVVSAQVFDRGWFTTEGEHRIEIREGTIADQFRAFTGYAPDEPLPVFLISTQLDHGLIPVTSVGREGGSLMPGLGTAVSTVEIEMPDGERFELPGVITSRIALSGTTTFEHELVPEALNELDNNFRWGEGRIEVTTNPANGLVELTADIERLEVLEGADPVVISGLSVAGEQRPTAFGIPLGNGRVFVESVSSGGPNPGPFEVEVGLDLDDDDLRVDVSLDMTSQAPEFGELGTVFELSATGLNPERFAAFVKKYQAVAALVPDPAMLGPMIEPEAQALMAAGLSLDIPHFDIELPDGKFESSLTLNIAPTDLDSFTWTSLLLAAEGQANVRVPEALLQTLIALNPEVGAMVGMGYLKSDGSDYVSEARYAKGILTINGAPMAIPIAAP